MNESELRTYIASQAPKLTAWASEIQGALDSRFRNLIALPIKSRLKEVQSAVDKFYRKQYSNPATQMTDLAGVRVVVLLQDQLSPVTNFLKEQPAWSLMQSRDFAEEIRKNPRIFDYQSEHFEVRPRRPLIIQGIEVDTAVCCEVQVRTLLQHAYAEVAHDSVYKGDTPPPSRSVRLLARSMALMEATDESLCNALREIRTINQPLEALLQSARQLYSERIAEVELTSVDHAVADAYRSHIGASSTGELRGLLAKKDWIYEEVQRRASAGLFQYSSILIVFLLATQMGDELLQIWPFASLYRDAKIVLSCLGE